MSVEYLSEDTITLRKALDYCKQLLETAIATSSCSLLPDKPTATTTENDGKSPSQQPQETTAAAIVVAHQIVDELLVQRTKALEAFWGKTKSGNQSCPIDSLDSLCSANDFVENYQWNNMPCLFRKGSGMEAYFESATSQWVRCNTEQNDDTGGTSLDNRTAVSESCVDWSWFLNHLGKDTHVPVRMEQQGKSKDDQHHELDALGRATTEYQTVYMSMTEWTSLLQESLGDDDDKNESNDRYYYLKDWHLVSWLAKTATDGQMRPLYIVPEHFQFDLLNHYLTKFTPTGDYRFVYWGPKGSFTSLHSDVLNSFSWSFNVKGTKKWTFYPPVPASGRDETNTVPQEERNEIMLIQHTGDCLFVPAGWNHTVVNLEETISINHNWVTTANLDLVWNCIKAEMESVRTELKLWDNLTLIHEDGNALESMLLGCAGIHVSGFVLMLSVRLLELLNQTERVPDIYYFFDIIRLAELLHSIKADPEVGLEIRLAGALDDPHLAQSAIETIAHALEIADQRCAR